MPGPSRVSDRPVSGGAVNTEEEEEDGVTHLINYTSACKAAPAMSVDCLAADLRQPIREERTKYLKNIIQFTYDITFNLKNIERLNALSDSTFSSTSTGEA